MKLIVPPKLKDGDKIAILSPAGIVKPNNVYGAVAVLKEQGWDPYVCPHAFKRYGTYAGTDQERLDDLKTALADPSTRAIMCSRGGYGVVHLLEALGKLDLRRDPKWVIGFSDISALHALLYSQGVASIHGHMTSHLASGKGDDDDSIALFDILNGFRLNYDFEPHRRNRKGTVRAPLVGGNLSVISDLIGTPFNMFQPGTILFIEDVSEPAYKIERMMYQLRLSGVMAKLGGLIVGKFSDCALEVDNKTVDHLISDIVAPFNFPVAYEAPIGHVSHNIPLIEGVPTTLAVTDDKVVIDQR